MLPTRGVVRDGKAGDWYHVSSTKQTAILRPITSGVPKLQFSIPAERDQLEQLLQGGEVYSIGRISAEVAGITEFAPGGYSHSDRDEWLRIVAVLEENRLRPRAPAQPVDLVPVSRLRRFYESLRLLDAAAVHSAIADHLAGDRDRTDVLDALFADSVEHLQRYQNAGQPFHQGVGRDWFAGYHGRPDQFARCLAARLAPEEGHRASFAIEGSDLEYLVIDYEVSPLRTAGGHRFEDGRSAASSGAGGMDLLLATRDGAPVVGEVKAPADTSVFVALVQALTYACEILTEQQVVRLQKAYPTTFNSSPEPFCEILILVSAGDSPRLEQQTARIVQNLLCDPERSVAKHIRRITVAEARFGEGGRPAFTLRYSEPSAYHSPSDRTRTGGSSSAAAESGDVV